MIKVGIIGCGNIFTMHATSAAHLENAKIVGVCDIKKDRADKAAKKYKVNAYYDYKEMIEKEKPDVVHVCVPHYLHPIISRYAIEAGVNVLCEKPMAIQYEDAVENVKLAKEKGVKYGIIFQCRYNDSARLVKENLDNGNLGKVMSESVQAAMSYIRSRTDRLQIPADFYKTKDIHVHFPEGAVPKDGPSAGITVCTAMVSALTGVPVRHDIAMTGEISIRGRVLAIGGLKEKTMAALRHGVRTVILPEENRKDLDEIDQTVRRALNFIPVRHVDEVLEAALEIPMRDTMAETETEKKENGLPVPPKQQAQKTGIRQ